MSNTKRKKRVRKVEVRRTVERTNGVVPAMAMRSRDIELVGLKTFTFAQAQKFQIDDGYQRGLKKQRIKNMAALLNAGYVIPRLVDVAARSDGTYYVFDGQQRFWAHMAAQKNITCVLWRFTNAKAEAKAFITWNNTVRVNPADKIRAWVGPSGALLRHLMGDEISALCGVLSWGPRSRIPIGVFAFGLHNALIGKDAKQLAKSSIEDVLARIDAAVCADKERAYEVARSFASVCAKVFPQGRHGYAIPVRALGVRAHAKWEGNGAAVPPKRVTTSLSRTNWDRFAPSASSVFLPSVLGAITKKW